MFNCGFKNFRCGFNFHSFGSRKVVDGVEYDE